MKTIEEQYKDLLEELLYRGVSKSDRTGTGTKSVFGRQIRHNMADGFPLLTTKKMAWKSMVTELFWFLRGGTNIKYLVENGCHIWNGDAMKNYERHNGEINWGPFVTKEEAFVDSILNVKGFAEKWGELGPIYGKQWRDWSINDEHVDGTIYFDYPNVDQIENLINDIKTNPDSRRLMVSAWNVGELSEMVLPPCHYGFQVYTREMDLDERIEKWCNSIGKHSSFGADFEHEDLDEKGFPRRTLSLMWNQRSVDTFLGLPFNIASYGLLLLILAKATNTVAEELIGNLGDVHLYNNHMVQAKEQVARIPFDLPHVEVELPVTGKLEDLEHHHVTLYDYQSHPSIKAPLSN
jgi:thymidylate synthase